MERVQSHTTDELHAKLCAENRGERRNMKHNYISARVVVFVISGTSWPLDTLSTCLTVVGTLRWATERGLVGAS